MVATSPVMFNYTAASVRPGISSGIVENGWGEQDKLRPATTGNFRNFTFETISAKQSRTANQAKLDECAPVAAAEILESDGPNFTPMMFDREFP